MAIMVVQGSLYHGYTIYISRGSTDCMPITEVHSTAAPTQNRGTQAAHLVPGGTEVEAAWRSFSFFFVSLHPSPSTWMWRADRGGGGGTSPSFLALR